MSCRHYARRIQRVALFAPLALFACSDVPTSVEREPSAVLIEPSLIELESGSSTTLRLVLLDASGRRLSRIPTGMSIHWDSEDRSIANVDAEGTVTARLPGVTGVTASVVYRNQSGGFGASASAAGGPPPHARASAKVSKGSAQFVPIGSTELSGIAGELVADSPTVQLVDRKGRGIADVPVRFRAEDGQLSSDVVLTDADGGARAAWWLGPEKGSQSLDAYVPELETDTVSFQAAASGGPAASAPAAGNGQSGTVGQPLSQPITVRVTDSDGQPVGGTRVYWAAGAGTVEQTSTLTNADGQASTAWTLGTAAGEQTASGTVGSLQPVLFSASASAGQPSALVKLSGDAQLANVSTTLPQPLVAQVTDAFGNPIAGVPVSWSTASTGAGTLTVEAPTTDAQGKARAAWTLGEVTGEHYARVSSQGLTDALFVAKAVGTGTITRIEISPAGPVSLTAPGDTVRLSVSARDGAGNIVDGGTYAWTSSKSTVAEVNAVGTVTAKTAGTALVIATLVGGTAADTVSVTVAPTVASISISPSSFQLEVGKTIALAAQPLDGNGNPVVAPVTWSSSAAGVAQVNASSGVVTGIAVGSAQITASAGGKTAAASASVYQTSQPPASGTAELPRIYIDTRYTARSGTTIRVPSGGDLQKAFNEAQPGDRILLAPGAVFRGTFTLPVKSGSGDIYVETETTLPSEGTRVAPGALQYAVLEQTVVDPVIRAPSGSRGWRFVGVEIRGAPALTFTYMMVELQPGSSHITFDRSYVHGHSTLNFQRCISANAAYFVAVDSYIAECHSKGFDSQAIGAWDSPGPYKIVNNYLEGAGENVMFGGADPIVAGTVLSDIEFRRNHVKKPQSWHGVWTVKNLFETKNAQRLLIEGNVFEGSWQDAQTGFAIVLKSSNDQGGCSWCITADLTFRYNIVRDAEMGFSISAGEDYNGGGFEYLRRVVVQHNLLERVNNRLFAVLSEVGAVTIDSNTALDIDAGLLCIFDGTPAQGAFILTNNLFGPSSGGCFGSTYGEGTAAFDHYFGAAGYSVAGNLFTGRRASAYPAGNYFALVNVPAGAGADLAEVSARTAGVVR